MFHYVSKWSSDDTTIFKQGITRRTPVNRAKEQAYPIKCYGLGVYDVELVSCVHIYTESHAELIESVWKREFKCGIDYALMPDGRTEAWISQDVDADIEKIKTAHLWSGGKDVTEKHYYSFNVLDVTEPKVEYYQLPESPAEREQRKAEEKVECEQRRAEAKVKRALARKAKKAADLVADKEAEIVRHKEKSEISFQVVYAINRMIGKHIWTKAKTKVEDYDALTKDVLTILTKASTINESESYIPRCIESLTKLFDKHLKLYNGIVVQYNEHRKTITQASESGMSKEDILVTHKDSVEYIKYWTPRMELGSMEELRRPMIGKLRELNSLLQTK